MGEQDVVLLPGESILLNQVPLKSIISNRRDSIMHCLQRLTVKGLGAGSSHQWLEAVQQTPRKAVMVKHFPTRRKEIPFIKARTAATPIKDQSFAIYWLLMSIVEYAIDIKCA